MCQSVESQEMNRRQIRIRIAPTRSKYTYIVYWDQRRYDKSPKIHWIDWKNGVSKRTEKKVFQSNKATETQIAISTAWTATLRIPPIIF